MITNNVKNEDLRTLIVCSFRYSIGRQTYMPTLVQKIIYRHWEVLNSVDFLQFSDTIDRKTDEQLGSSFDARDWRKFASWCKSKLGEEHVR